MASEPKDLILLIWVHGFKGNEVTFESFPERISHLLKATHVSLRVESRVFPAYQTRGELKAATLAFVDWLTELVVNLENDHGGGGGAGKAKIVLMGHSMGGLLIADAALDIAANTRKGDPLWPKVVALMAFDTPYLGLHPHTFKHHLTQAAGYVEQARNIASAVTMMSPVAFGLGFGKFGGKGKEDSEAGPSTSGSSRSSSAAGSRPSSVPPSRKGKEAASNVAAPDYSDSASGAAQETTGKSFWSGMTMPSLSTLQPPSAKTLYGLGAVALGAAAVGTAYYRREDFVNGWKWGFDHMTFVRNLWDDEGMKGRLIEIERLQIDHDVPFWNFYTHLPPCPPTQLVSRTFAILPPMNHPLYPRFKAASNTIAKDEVSAHMGMFNPRTNDGFYDLGLEVVRAIGERLEREGVDRANGADETIEKQEEEWRVEMDEKGNEVWVEK